MDERPTAESEMLARASLRQRWLSAFGRMGVVTVGQARAMSVEDLQAIANIGPKIVADVTAALADPTLRSEDLLERLRPARLGLISERDRELVRLREAGASIRALARRFEISSGRVREILARIGHP